MFQPSAFQNQWSTSFTAVFPPNLCPFLLCDINVPFTWGPLGLCYGHLHSPLPPCLWAFAAKGLRTRTRPNANPLLQHIHNQVRAAPKAQDLCCPTPRSSQKSLTPRREPLSDEQQNQHAWVQHLVLRRTSSLEGLPWDKPDRHSADSIAKHIHLLTLLLPLACLLHSYHRHLST